jgi:hypothetical protein
MGVHAAVQTTETIFKRDCEQLVHSLTTAFDVTNVSARSRIERWLEPMANELT